MIGFVSGRLDYISESSIIVENNGIGYEIFVPVSVSARLVVDSEVKIYTYMNVREDAVQLFGFTSRDDLEVFKLLITVSGVGPKVALGILGFMTADDIRFAVMADDAKTIAKAPGIGPKTAGKLILELKDKLKIRDVVEDALDRGKLKNGQTGSDFSEITAEEALTALGYSAADAMRGVSSVEITEDMTVEKLLKLSLKNM